MSSDVGEHDPIKPKLSSAAATITDLSHLTNERLESTIAVSEFLTRYHKQIAVSVSDDDDSDTDGDKDDNDVGSDHANDDKPSGTDRGDDESRDEVIISPQDVLSAMDYRADRERYNLLSSVINTVKCPNFDPSGVHRDHKKLDKLLHEEGKKIWRRMQRRIGSGQGRMSTDEDVINLVEVMEIKMAKDVSTEMLFNPSIRTKQRSSNKLPSASTLLGVPSGNFMSWVLPHCRFEAKEFGQDKNKNGDVNGNGTGNGSKSNASASKNSASSEPTPPSPTLPVPANALTWKELLRISKMISNIPEEDREAIHTSPLTNSILSGANFQPDSLSSSSNKHKNNLLYLSSRDRLSGEDKLLTSFTSELRGTDLMALWVRAQRDTGASRHLLGLFEIEKVVSRREQERERSRRKNEVINLTDESDQVPSEISFVPDSVYDNEDPDCEYEPQHMATYVGNPSKIKGRIEKEAPIMDKLVEWAIFNQAYFTANHMRKEISMDPKIGVNSEMSKSNSSNKRNGGHLGTDIREKKKRRMDLTMSKGLMFAYMSFLLKLLFRRNRNILNLVVSSDIVHKEKKPMNTNDLNSVDDDDIDLTQVGDGIKEYLKIKFNSTDRTLSRICRRIVLNKFPDLSSFKNVVFHLLEALESTLLENEVLFNQVKTAKADFAFLCDTVLPTVKHRHTALFDISEGKENLMDDDTIAKVLNMHPKPWQEEKCELCSKKMSKDDSKTCWYCNTTVHIPCVPCKSTSHPTHLENMKYLLGIYMSAKDYPEEPDFVTNPISWEEKELNLIRKPSEDGKLPKWGMIMQNTELCEEHFDKSFHHLMNPLKWETIDELSPDSLDIVVPVRVPHVGMIVKESSGVAMKYGLKVGDVLIGIKTSGLMKYFKDISNADERKQLMVNALETMTMIVFRPSKPILSIAEQFRDAVLDAHRKASKLLEKLMSRRWYCDVCEARDHNTLSQDSSDEISNCLMVVQRLGMEQSFLPFCEEKFKDDGTNHDNAIRDEEIISLNSSDSGSIDKSLPNMDHFKHISLRRLDKIFLSLKTPGPLDSSHYSPPWTKREKLCWISEKLRSKPFQLLCAGMILILKRAKLQGSNQHERQEIVDNFMLLSIPLCLDHKGDPSTSVKRSILPWVLPTCKNCKVCHVEDMNICLCAHCRKLKKDDLSIDDDTLLPEHLCSNALLRYDLHCSYIGTTILAQINDPLIIKVSKKTQLIVDEGRRNVELLVLSYVPRRFISKSKMDGLVYEGESYSFHNRWQSAEGLFYVLPILSNFQLGFITQFCNSCREGEYPSDSQMLSLDGIIALTPDELMVRLKESLSMHFAVDRSVESIAKQFGNQSLPIMVVGERDSVGQHDYSTSMLRMISNCDYSDVAQILCRDNTHVNRQNVFFQTRRFQEELDLCVNFHNAKSVSFISGESKHHSIEMLSSKVLERDMHTSYFDFYRKDMNRKMWRRVLLAKNKKVASESTSNLKLLTGMHLFPPSKSEKEKLCKLWYSDLFYWSYGSKNFKERLYADMAPLMQQVSKDLLFEPKPFYPTAKDVKTMFFVLHRDFCQTPGNDDYDIESDEDEFTPSNDIRPKRTAKFHGKGWGFELVCWRSEKGVVRIGRVAPFSPASLSGLRTHDVLVTVNGKPIASFTKTAVATALLEEVGTEPKESIDVSASIQILSRIKTKRPIQGPIVIEILRSDINYTSAVSQKSVPSSTLKHQKRPSTATNSVSLPQNVPIRPAPTVAYQNAHGNVVPHSDNRNLSKQIYIQQQAQPTNRPPVQQQQAQPPNRPPVQLHQHQVQPLLHPQLPLRPNNGLQIQVQPVHRPQTAVQQQVLSPHQPYNKHLPDKLIDVAPLNRRIFLNESHLYKRSVNDTFLTLAETTLLVYAINHNHPKLSTRLLSPRYSLRRVNEEYTKRIKPFLEANGFNRIPDLSDALWQSILSYDHKRMQSETGPTIFYEDNFGYKEPTEVFPIDRFLEQYFLAKKRRSSTQNLRSPIDTVNFMNEGRRIGNENVITQYSHAPNHNGDTMRIRGGGEGGVPPDIHNGNYYKAGQKSAVSLELQDIKKMNESVSSLLGFLPDGRCVLWFLSDPGAVYIHNETSDISLAAAAMTLSQKSEIDPNEDGKENLDVDNRKEKDVYTCPWGCCTKQNDSHRFLSFETITQWQDHIETYHSYSLSSPKAYFRRIGDGKSIKYLCADLTSHICLRSPDLEKYTREFQRNNETNEGFFRSPSSKSIIFDLKVIPVKDENSFSHAIQLWQRLAVLFNIEGDGNSSFINAGDVGRRKIIHKDGIATEQKQLVKNIENCIQDIMASAPLKTPKESMKKTSCVRLQNDPSNCLNCRVCRANHEAILISVKGEDSSHGTGCSLVCELCYGGNKSSIREKMLLAIKRIQPVKGDFDLLKVLLLKVASNIPLSLQKKSLSMFSEPPLESFWNSIDKWIRFACSCSNIRMLGQALIMLNSSINVGKLPRWWKSSKCGWTCSLVILQNPTISSLFLQLSMFDIAVSEYAASAKDDIDFTGENHVVEKNDTMPDEDSNILESSNSFQWPNNDFEALLNEMDVKEKYKLLEALATKFGLQEYDDEYDDSCMVCGSGGDLLCCEYCQNVVHQACTGYKGDLEDVIYVCVECVADITALKKAWDTERAKHS